MLVQVYIPPAVTLGSRVTYSHVEEPYVYSVLINYSDITLYTNHYSMLLF